MIKKFRKIDSETNEEKEVKVIIPKNFEKDIIALEEFLEGPIEFGDEINVTLQDALSIMPRERKRKDSYFTLVKFLKEELNIELTIKSRGFRNQSNP